MDGKTVSHWKSGTYVPVWVAREVVAREVVARDVVAREVVAREVVARAITYTNSARFEWNNCNVGAIEVKETLPKEEKLTTLNSQHQQFFSDEKRKNIFFCQVSSTLIKVIYIL